MDAVGMLKETYVNPLICQAFLYPPGHPKCQSIYSLLIMCLLHVSWHNLNHSQYSSIGSEYKPTYSIVHVFKLRWNPESEQFNWVMVWLYSVTLQLWKFVSLKITIQSLKQRAMWSLTWELLESTLSLWMPQSLAQKALQQVRCLYYTPVAAHFMSGMYWHFYLSWILWCMQYHFKLLHILLTPTRWWLHVWWDNSTASNAFFTKYGTGYYWRSP